MNRHGRFYLDAMQKYQTELIWGELKRICKLGHIVEMQGPGILKRESYRIIIDGHATERDKFTDAGAHAIIAWENRENEKL